MQKELRILLKPLFKFLDVFSHVLTCSGQPIPDSGLSFSSATAEKRYFQSLESV